MNRKFDHLTKPGKKCNLVGIGVHGFTLIEVIISLAVISMLMAAIINMFSSLSQSYTTQNIAAGIQQVVRTGIDIIAQNIRMAGFNPLKIPDVGFSNDISENRIHFSYDLDEDGAIADDEQNRTLELYFTRSIYRTDYILGKALSLLIAAFLMELPPMTVLFASFATRSPKALSMHGFGVLPLYFGTIGFIFSQMRSIFQ